MLAQGCCGWTLLWGESCSHSYNLSDKSAGSGFEQPQAGPLGAAQGCAALIHPANPTGPQAIEKLQVSSATLNEARLVYLGPVCPGNHPRTMEFNPGAARR